MTVTELIEALEDEPGDWQVHVSPVFPHRAGLAEEDRQPGRITGFEESRRDRHPDGRLKDDAGNLAPAGIVYLGVYTPWDDDQD